jgi:hypothetical protein
MPSKGKSTTKKSASDAEVQKKVDAAVQKKVDAAVLKEQQKAQAAQAASDKLLREEQEKAQAKQAELEAQLEIARKAAEAAEAAKDPFTGVRSAIGLAVNMMFAVGGFFIRAEFPHSGYHHGNPKSVQRAYDGLLTGPVEPAEPVEPAKPSGPPDGSLGEPAVPIQGAEKEQKKRSTKKRNSTPPAEEDAEEGAAGEAGPSKKKPKVKKVWEMPHAGNPPADAAWPTRQVYIVQEGFFDRIGSELWRLLLPEDPTRPGAFDMEALALIMTVVMTNAFGDFYWEVNTQKQLFTVARRMLEMTLNALYFSKGYNTLVGFENRIRENIGDAQWVLMMTMTHTAPEHLFALRRYAPSRLVTEEHKLPRITYDVLLHAIKNHMSLGEADAVPETDLVQYPIAGNEANVNYNPKGKTDVRQ